MSRLFELSSYKNEHCVIVQDLPNLELMILFTGSKIECKDLLDKLQEAEARGFLKGNTK